MEDKGVKDTRIGELPEASHVTSLSWFLPPGLENWTMNQCCQLRYYCIPVSVLGWRYERSSWMLRGARSTDMLFGCAAGGEDEDEERTLDDELTGAIDTA